MFSFLYTPEPVYIRNNPLSGICFVVPTMYMISSGQKRMWVVHDCVKTFGVLTAPSEGKVPIVLFTPAKTVKLLQLYSKT